MTGWLSYSDRHAFVLTLAGLVLLYGVRRMTEGVDAPHASAIRSSVALAALSWLSFLTGFLLVELEKPGLLPLVFFTLAIGVYFAVRDPSLAVTFGGQSDRVWRPALVAALVAGWLVGTWDAVGPMPFTLLSAILAGGVILSVVREQLPDAGGVSFPVFVGATAADTAFPGHLVAPAPVPAPSDERGVRDHLDQRRALMGERPRKRLVEPSGALDADAERPTAS